jgi:uncharacterized protein YhaN
MIPYKANLAEYFAMRKTIGALFHAVTADAEETFETASTSATTKEAHESAHRLFKAQLRAAKETRTALLKELGPQPVIPTVAEINK